MKTGCQALKTNIVITGHFIHGIVHAAVSVLIVWCCWTSNKCPIKDMGIGSFALEDTPVTLGGLVFAEAGAMVGVHRVILSITYYETVKIFFE